MENTLLRLVQKQTPNATLSPVGPSHYRIVLFAKNTAARPLIYSPDWNTPKIQKIYRALAQNIAQHDAYESSHPRASVPHRSRFRWAAAQVANRQSHWQR